MNYLMIIIGFVIGSFCTKEFYDNLIIPEINKVAEVSKTEAVNAATTRCQEQMTAATRVAAERAKLAEHDRLQEIHQKALKEYNVTLQKSEHDLADARQEQAIRDKQYELQLKQEGKSCLLDNSDIDYLERMHN